MKIAILNYCLIGLALSSCDSQFDYSIPENRDRSFSRSIVSDVAAVQTYTFPSISEITSSEIVRTAMEAAWKETMDYAYNHVYRREVGFFIYSDPDSKKFYVGNTVYGPDSDWYDETPAHVFLGPPTNNLAVCAFFHTHPPLSCFPYDVYRPTGHSLADEYYSDTYNLPGLVYDYIGDDDGLLHGCRGNFDEIYRNPANIYIFGPERRSPIYTQ